MVAAHAVFDLLCEAFDIGYFGTLEDMDECVESIMSNTVVIITVCVKVANSTFLVTIKRTKWAELSRYYLCSCFVR